MLVDGEEAEIKLVGDCMIGVEMSEGAHTVTYVHRNEAFSLGWKISLCSGLLLLILYLAVYRPKMPVKVKGKFEK